jgi:hypothetical protein
LAGDGGTERGQGGQAGDCGDCGERRAQLARNCGIPRAGCRSFTPSEWILPMGRGLPVPT